MQNSGECLRRFWVVIAIGVVFALGALQRSIPAAEAQAEGLALALIPLCWSG